MLLKIGELVSSLVALTYELDGESCTLPKGAKGIYAGLINYKDDTQNHEVWFDIGQGCGYGVPIVVSLDQVEEFQSDAEVTW